MPQVVKCPVGSVQAGNKLLTDFGCETLFRLNIGFFRYPLSSALE